MNHALAEGVELLVTATKGLTQMGGVEVELQGSKSFAGK